MGRRIPIMKVGAFGIRTPFFYNLSDDEIKIYRELQYLEDLTDIKELKQRLPQIKALDKCVRKLSAHGFVEIMTLNGETLLMANN